MRGAGAAADIETLAQARADNSAGQTPHRMREGLDAAVGLAKILNDIWSNQKCNYRRFAVINRVCSVHYAARESESYFQGRAGIIAVIRREKSNRPQN
jgi:hypothetical protein